MKIITPTIEDKNINDALEPHYKLYSEMTLSEQYFLTSTIRAYHPKKLLELGVASGSSSVLILNAIKGVEDSHLTSIDYSTSYYRDKTKNTGFIVDKYPELKNNWAFYTGGMASEFMDKIGGDIDFCFIDTNHSLPGELIDFLLILPYLKPNAVVVVHDTNLQTWGNWPQCTSNNMLVSALSGEKLIPETFESVFYHNTLKKDFQMYFPNITGIKLDGNQKDKIWDIFNLLTQKWKYIPNSSDIQSIRTSLRKHYSEFYVQLFERILSYQMNIAKNDQTIQDIVKEYRNTIDNKIQESILANQNLSEEQINLINKTFEHIAGQIQENFQSIHKDLSQSNSIQDIIKEYRDVVETKIQESILANQNLSKEQISLIKRTFEHIPKQVQEVFQSIYKDLSQSNSVISDNVHNVMRTIDESKSFFSQKQEEVFKQILNVFSDDKIESKNTLASMKTEFASGLSNQTIKIDAIKSNIEEIIKVANSNLGIKLSDYFSSGHSDINDLSHNINCVQQNLGKKYDVLSKEFDTLKLLMCYSTVRKQYFFYKILRWFVFSSKRKKYKSKYNEIKPIYKKIRKLLHEFK